MAPHPDAPAVAPQDADQEDLQYAPITMGGRASMASSTTQHHEPSQHQEPSTKERRDPNLDLALPYRTLTADANMAEYTTENPRGEIPAARKPDGRGCY